jgi:formylglycine-generating enzyme required for sulfatase activity/predicted Ser/Thr protein kinase
LDREVALKVPHPDALNTPQRMQRFLREARAAAKLRHPHIVPVFEVGQEGDISFIVTAYIDGQPLSSVVAEGGLDCRRAARIVRALAEGLACAHEQGIVHRDVKPANIMLDRKDKPLLMDFGLAASQEGGEKLTRAGAILGTPAYMAPEQAAGQQGEAKPAVDQYALGVVLYELLTGLTPFAGPPAVVLYNAVHTPPERPRQRRPDIPEELEAICLKAMAKKPEDRYASCQALSDELGRWLDNQTVSVTAAKNTQDQPWWQGETMEAGPMAAPVLDNEETFGFFGQGALSGEADGLPREAGVAPGTVEQKRKNRPWWQGASPVGWSGGVRARWPILAAAGAAALVLVLLGIILVIKYRGADGRTPELSVELHSTNEPMMKRSSEQRPKPDGTLTARYQNSLGMEFVLVGKGTAWLGGGGGKKGEQKVDIPYNFYLGVYEVTQDEWQKVTGTNPSAFSRQGGQRDVVKDIPDDELRRFPVEMLSWNDAQAFLEGLNKRVQEPGWAYRLPREDEWKYACRGGPLSDPLDSAFDFYFDKPTNQLLPGQANFKHEGKNLPRTCKVGSYKQPFQHGRLFAIL